MKRGFVPKYYDVTGCTVDEFVKYNPCIDSSRIERLTDNSFRVYLPLQDKRSSAARLWSSITGWFGRHIEINYLYSHMWLEISINHDLFYHVVIYLLFWRRGLAIHLWEKKHD